MDTFSDKVMKALSSLNQCIHAPDYGDEFYNMVETNQLQEQKKDEKYRRSPEMILTHTAMGFGAEKALHHTGLFQPVSEVTKLRQGITYANGKKDVYCEEFIAEVKTKSNRFEDWFISKSQYNSIKECVKYNDFIIVVEYNQIDLLTYDYKPQYLVDIKSILKYIDTSKETRHGSYTFQHRKAIANGDCINLRSAA